MNVNDCESMCLSPTPRKGIYRHSIWRLANWLTTNVALLLSDDHLSWVLCLFGGLIAYVSTWLTLRHLVSSCVDMCHAHGILDTLYLCIFVRSIVRIRIRKLVGVPHHLRRGARWSWV